MNNKLCYEFVYVYKMLLETDKKDKPLPITGKSQVART